MDIFILVIIFLIIHFLKEFIPFRFKSSFYSIVLFFLIIGSIRYFQNVNIFLLFSLFLDLSLLMSGKYKTFTLSKFVLLFLSIKYFNLNIFLNQVIIGFMSYISFFYIVKNEKNLSAANELLLKKSKELNIIRKTSLLLQKSLDYEELIEVLLNTLTSKEALDYDRALIFLYDERMNEFTPYYLKYKNHDKKISLYSKEEEENPIRKIKIPNSIINPFGKAYDTKEPIVINNIDLNDPIQRLVWELLNLANFGLLPLIEKNSIKGIIMVDNYNTKLPIENEDLDNTVSIIHQASTALVNSSLYKQSQNMAYTDGLTGLFNKRFLDFSFEQSLSKLLSKESSLALLIVDVDYFKRYNDTNGHIAGNMALKRIAELLLAESRNKDVVVRFGGEEFCILLFDIEKIGALGVAERMRFKIEKENFIKESKEASGQLTISIGISIFNGENNLEELVDKADKALYEAKNSGRNRIIFYSGDNHD